MELLLQKNNTKEVVIMQWQNPYFNLDNNKEVHFLEHANHSWKDKFPTMVGVKGNVLRRSKTREKECWEYILVSNNSSLEIIHYREIITFDQNKAPLKYRKVCRPSIHPNRWEHELTLIKCRNKQCGHFKVFWEEVNEKYNPLSFCRNSIICTSCEGLKKTQDQLRDRNRPITILEYSYHHDRNYQNVQYTSRFENTYQTRSLFLCDCGHCWTQEKSNQTIVCPECDISSGSANDAFYMWRMGDGNDGEPDYKIGVTSRRLGDQRIRDVANKWRVNPHVLLLVDAFDATKIERMVRKKYLYNRPYMDSDKDGKTEIYRFSESEAEIVLEMLKIACQESLKNTKIAKKKKRKHKMIGRVKAESGYRVYQYPDL